MALRVALVPPFAWSQPHDVNEHVAGLAGELRRRGHAVTVLAPSNRARDLAAGRRALADGVQVTPGPGSSLSPDTTVTPNVGSLAPGNLPEVVALGPAVPISPRSRMGGPAGVRANLAVARAAAPFAARHGFQPWRPRPPDT